MSETLIRRRETSLPGPSPLCPLPWCPLVSGERGTHRLDPAGSLPALGPHTGSCCPLARPRGWLFLDGHSFEVSESLPLLSTFFPFLLMLRFLPIVVKHTWHEMYHFNHVSVYSSAAFGSFTPLLYDHHHCLFAELPFLPSETLWTQ